MSRKQITSKVQKIISIAISFSLLSSRTVVASGANSDQFSIQDFLSTQLSKVISKDCSLDSQKVKSLNLNLLKLGFGSENNGIWQDHSAISYDRLKTNNLFNNELPDQSHNMNRYQLIRNVIAYDAVQSAKELAIDLMKRTGSCIDENTYQEEFNDLVLQVLSLKPYNLSKHPLASPLYNEGGIYSKESIESFLEEDQEHFETEADTQVEPKLRMIMKQQARELTEVLVSKTLLLSGKIKGSISANDINDDDIQVLTTTYYPNVVKLIRLLYLDHQIGRTFWLGRSLLASAQLILADKGKSTRINFLNNLTTRLNNDESFKNFKLENIFGSKWVLPNESYDTQKLKYNIENYLNQRRVQALNYFNSLISSTVNSILLPNSGLLSQNNVESEVNFDTQLGIDFNLNSIPSNITYKEVPITNMSYVLTRNISLESAMIPSGALPPKKLQELEKNKQLIGKYIGAINYVSAEDAAENDKSSLRHRLNEIRERAFYRTLNTGYSHIGYATVRKVVVNEKEPQEIAMSWVIDNYPSPAADAETDIVGPYNSAGVRFIGLEQYYKSSAHTHLLVASIDPSKFSEFVAKQVNQIESETDFKNSLKPRTSDSSDVRHSYQVITPTLDTFGKPIPTDTSDINKVSSTWNFEIGYDDFKKLHNKNIYVSDKGWYEAVSKKAVDTLTEFMYKGMTFVWITPNGQYYKGGAYCSLTGALAFKLGTGIDIQDQADVWDGLVSVISTAYSTAQSINGKCESKKSFNQNGKFDLTSKLLTDSVCEQAKSLVDNSEVKNIYTLSKMPIVAPSGLVAQEFIPAENMYRVEAPFLPIQDRLESGFSSKKIKTTSKSLEILNFSKNKIKESINLFLSQSADNESSPSVVVSANNPSANSSSSISSIFDSAKALNRYLIPAYQNPKLKTKVINNLQSFDFMKMNLDPAELRGLTMDLTESSISKMGCTETSTSSVCLDLKATKKGH